MNRAKPIRYILKYLKEGVLLFFVVSGEGSSHQLIVKLDCCCGEVRDRVKTHVLFASSGAIGFRLK